MDLKEVDGSVWTRLIWLRKRTSGSVCVCVCVCVCGDHGSEKSDPMKCEEFHPRATSLKIRVANIF